MAGRMSLKSFLEHADTSGGPDSCGVEFYSADRVRVNKPNNKILGCSDLKVGLFCRVNRKTYMEGKPYSLIIEFKKQPIGIIL
jgi:hypothetical protein